MIGGDPQLREMSLAVMGVCSCEVVGRREIEAAEAQGTGCISALISVASTALRTLTHMHCLAVLQRLSLRGRLQSKMIRMGALDVVLKLLESVRKPEGDAHTWCRLGPGEGPETPDFSIEFTSALLMNLTLRSAGRKRCAELGAYAILVGLIEHPNAQVRTHINGTLYTLLGVKAIRSEAQKRGAEAVFRSALERVSPENDLLQRQLEFLLHQLSRSTSEGDSDNEESDPEPDPPEAESAGDADDGDNFLDEEELAAHFHLASISAVGPGDGYSQADLDANTKAAMAEAAAAEEALRYFRATAGPVADSQQRRLGHWKACLVLTAYTVPVEVNVQGQSGKFTIVPKGSSGNSVGIRVTMDALREVDASGNAVGQSGSVKHSVNTFASQDFTVGDVELVSIGSVSASKVSFESTISSIGKLGVDTYLIATSGTVGMNTDSWEVGMGDLKWNIRLWDWTWCGDVGATCKNGEVGDAVELDITVTNMGGGSASEKEGDKKEVSLGGSAELSLSTAVQTDCVWEEMAAGYPMITTQGSGTTLTFRFPRFIDSSLYDPVVSGSCDELGLDCSSTTTGSTVFSTTGTGSTTDDDSTTEDDSTTDDDSTTEDGTGTTEDPTDPGSAASEPAGVALAAGLALTSFAFA
ncbi:LisH domain-containing protein ARMC9 (Armadillo repeat-containing protein 9) [Durusdinium trenchii]|uniref:LisH domain-containing protein ARMC9 (Armadillo repeat-containing protein 9) n=1 Tax=Durusdinium trenchii TaxID=1381693 RepID=A0ABP0JLN8_9DINO